MIDRLSNWRCLWRLQGGRVWWWWGMEYGAWISKGIIDDTELCDNWCPQPWDTLTDVLADRHLLWDRFSCTLTEFWVSYCQAYSLKVEQRMHELFSLRFLPRYAFKFSIQTLSFSVDNPSELWMRLWRKREIKARENGSDYPQLEWYDL